MADVMGATSSFTALNDVLGRDRAAILAFNQGATFLCEVVRKVVCLLLPLLVVFVNKDGLHAVFIKALDGTEASLFLILLLD